MKNQKVASVPKKSKPRGRLAGNLTTLAKFPLFSLKDAKRAGFSQPTVQRAVDRGELLRIGRNLYRHPDSTLDPAIEDFAVACSHFGKTSAIGGLTALYHYALTDQPPQQLWVIVSPACKSRNKFYRLIRTMTPTKIGIEAHDHYKISSLERTLVESLKFASKIGLKTALEACHQAFKDKKTTPERVLSMARKLKLERAVLKYWDTLLLGNNE